MKHKEFKRNVERHGCVLKFKEGRTYVIDGSRPFRDLMSARIYGVIAETDNTDYSYSIMKGMSVGFRVETNNRALAQEIIEYGMTPYGDRHEPKQYMYKLPEEFESIVDGPVYIVKKAEKGLRFSGSDKLGPRKFTREEVADFSEKTQEIFKACEEIEFLEREEEDEID